MIYNKVKNTNVLMINGLRKAPSLIKLKPNYSFKKNW